MNFPALESPGYTRNIIHEVALEIYKLKNKTQNAHIITASEAEPALSVGALFFEEGGGAVALLRDFDGDGEGPADFLAGEGEDEDLSAGDGDGADLDFFGAGAGAGADFDFVGAEANGDEEGADRGVAAAETTTATFCPASQ